MIVYRITNEAYKNDISGNGAALYGSRWNSKGIHLLYTSQFISLSILESLVHLRRNEIPPAQYLLHIEFPDEKKIAEISYKKMKKDWQEEFEYTQWIGDQFMKNQEGLVLKVPSAIVPQEHNFLFNPLHAEFKKVKIVSSELLELDKRLNEYKGRL
ncbi:MAG TPA: RES family NAD+ phosphorylase [Hanamia sp.]|nr:RES family NAD+ phosphorylase [Hanamia sp.]